MTLSAAGERPPPAGKTIQEAEGRERGDVSRTVGASSEDLFRPRGGVSAAILEAQEEQKRMAHERRIEQKKKEQRGRRRAGPLWSAL